MDLNDIPVFLKVAQLGSFTAAGRALGLPKTTVSRRVSRLEEAVGVRLIQRTTRSLSLTPAGRRFFDESQQAIAMVEEAGRRTADVASEPSGIIRVSAPADTSFLSEAICSFVKAHPKVRMELILTDQHLNLVEDGIDVAIRAGTLADSTLVARKIGPTRRIFVASPEYLKAAGEPRTPADLVKHDCIVFGRGLDGATWQIQGDEGPEFVPVRGRVSVNTMHFAVRAAVEGLGIALIPSPMAAPDIRDGRLRSILRDYDPPLGGLYAVFPSNRHLPVAVKTFVDYVEQSLSWLKSTSGLVAEPLDPPCPEEDKPR